VKALTAMSRWSAYILCAIPFLLAGAISVLRPGYITPLFTTALGRFLIVVALCGIAIGALILKKIVSVRIA
jgi:tight adherence protein B